MPHVREIMTAGGTIECREYYTARFGKKGQKRAKHKNESPIAVQIINHRNSERILRGMLRENFRTGDWWVALRYKQGSRIDDEQAKKDARRFLRKLKKVYAAEGKELKYIYIIERLNRAVHLHIVLPAADAAKIRDCWMETTPLAKSAYFTPLWSGDFATKLAHYILKEYDPRNEVYRKPEGAKYHASRNLAKPVIEKQIIKRAKIAKKPYVKKGYILMPETYFEGVDAFSGYEYRTYTLIRQ